VVGIYGYTPVRHASGGPGILLNRCRLHKTKKDTVGLVFILYEAGTQNLQVAWSLKTVTHCIPLHGETGLPVRIKK